MNENQYEKCGEGVLYGLTGDGKISYTYLVESQPRRHVVDHVCDSSCRSHIILFWAGERIQGYAG